MKMKRLLSLGIALVVISPTAFIISCGTKVKPLKKHSYDITWNIEAGKYHSESFGSFHIEAGTSFVMPIIFRGRKKNISLPNGDITYTNITFTPTMNEVMKDKVSRWNYDTGMNMYYINNGLQAGITGRGSGVDHIIAIYTVTPTD